MIALKQTMSLWECNDKVRACVRGEYHHSVHTKLPALRPWEAQEIQIFLRTGSAQIPTAFDKTDAVRLTQVVDADGNRWLIPDSPGTIKQEERSAVGGYAAAICAQLAPFETFIVHFFRGELIRGHFGCNRPGTVQNPTILWRRGSQ